MQYRPLGTTGLDVSLICLGTMTWGEQNTESEAHQQLDWALERGINFIDTAEMYPIPPRRETQGSTERLLGPWLARNRHRRGDIVLATKIAGPGRRDWIRNGDTRVSAKTIPWAIDDSLKRLQTDYIDLYQTHWPDPHVPVEDTLEALDRLVEVGVVDDARYGREIAASLLRSGPVSPEHLVSRLVSRGIEPEVARDVADAGRVVITKGALEHLQEALA